jgi:hypothetical protein
MTYRGKVSNGVVVLDGATPPEGTVVEVTPLGVGTSDITDHPAVGIWKNRTDLPEDSAEASRVLRERMMRRTDE